MASLTLPALSHTEARWFLLAAAPAMFAALADAGRLLARLDAAAPDPEAALAIKLTRRTVESALKEARGED